jgi:hypothetical protein
VLKNVLDYARPEWNKKAARFVGRGAMGGAQLPFKSLCVARQPLTSVIESAHGIAPLCRGGFCFHGAPATIVRRRA